MSNSSWGPLLARMNELRDLEGILGLLSWDEETYLPSGGREARGQQTATLEAIRHQRLVDPALGELLERAAAGALEPDARVAVARLSRQRALATRVPESLVKALAEARSASLSAWQAARAASDFSRFRPHLEEILRLSRERAAALAAPGTEPYDALLDEYEPGMTTATLAPVLESLRRGLVPLVEAIAGSGVRPDTSFLERSYPAESQWALTMRLLADLGFDLERGRQDRSAHPFSSGSSADDVRLTTRIVETDPLSALFSTIHECGHGLYEQGFDPAHRRTPLAAAPSMGLHESQSRLWENQVGRSLAFWRRYLPVMRAAFPEQLAGVELETFHRAVNVVEPSLIRTEADEVTYNLHILVRFELERALLSGDLPVADLPGAWTERMRRYLGVVPPDDARGCLQDIHWAWGSIGYFPSYSLGNLWAAQLFAAYERERPELWADFEAGAFGPLLEWLRARVHRRGHLADASTIVAEATGEALSVEPLLAQLWGRYGSAYGVRRPG